MGGLRLRLNCFKMVKRKIAFVLDIPSQTSPMPENGLSTRYSFIGVQKDFNQSTDNQLPWQLFHPYSVSSFSAFPENDFTTDLSIYK